MIILRSIELLVWGINIGYGPDSEKGLLAISWKGGDGMEADFHNHGVYPDES